MAAVCQHELITTTINALYVDNDHEITKLIEGLSHQWRRLIRNCEQSDICASRMDTT